MIKGVLISGASVILAALPGTSNYQLRDYGFGSGGGNTGTDNYSLEGIAGDLSGSGNTSTNYGLKAGLLGSQLSALPDAPTWQNPDDWYNKLELTINPSGNPDDTTFAVAISDDNFVTTGYVQSDNTVGPALGIEDFRDYSSWGGSNGINVIGLSQDTTYQVKVKARQGEFAETSFGPTASAATSQVSLIFDLDIASIDQESSPPYIVNFGNISPDTVTDSPQLIWVDIDSNGENGTHVHIVSENSGLLSAATNHTISTVSGDLSILGEGFGVQNTSTTVSGGGPLSANSPYNGALANVGAVDNQFRQLVGSSGPVSSGRASFLLKLKTTTTTPSANDYIDIYTLIAATSY